MSETATHRDAAHGAPELGRAGDVALVVFLAFVGFPVVQMLDAGPSVAHAALVLALVAAFVVIYVRAMLAEPAPADARRSLVALAVLAAAVPIVDERPFSLLFIYVAAASGFLLRGRAAPRAVVACAIAAAGLAVARFGDADAAVTFGLYSLGIGFMLIGAARLSTTNAALAEAREELARLAVAEERARFARDLHDLLGHSLSVVALKSQLGRRLVDADPERAKTELAEIEQVTRGALVEVREAVSGYRRTTLADELAGARTALAAAGIEVDVERDAGLLPPDVDALLAWTVREGATNVIRHSGASTCTIAVRRAGDAAEVEIADDGRGGPPPQADDARSGLQGLRERAAALGGRLEAGAGPRGGFRLRVTVPAA